MRNSTTIAPVSNETVVPAVKRCKTCGRPYVGGQWQEHRQTHPRAVQAREARIRSLLDEGHPQAVVARMVGVSRQRVNQIARGAA